MAKACHFIAVIQGYWVRSRQIGESMLVHICLFSWVDSLLEIKFPFCFSGHLSCCQQIGTPQWGLLVRMQDFMSSFALSMATHWPAVFAMSLGTQLCCSHSLQGNLIYSSQVREKQFQKGEDLVSIFEANYPSHLLAANSPFTLTFRNIWCFKIMSSSRIFY